MGTNENSKNILISHDITSEERRRLERKRKERKNEKSVRMNKVHWLEKPKRVNKNVKKLVRKFEWTN